MRRSSSLWVAILAICALPGAVRAQPPGVGGLGASRPVYSPYLNLARRDVPPGVNYYGLVRPQVAAQSGLQSLQQQITQVQRASTIAPAPVASDALPVTGQQVFFLNTGRYFMNNSIGAPISGPTVSRSGAAVRPRR